MLKLKGSFPLFVLLASTLFWTWRTPDRSPRLYEVASGRATFISQHDGIGDRIESLTTNAAVRAGLMLAGVKPRKIRKWQEEAEARFWLKELLPGRAVLVHEPEMGELASPGWVAVSWIGSRQLRLRLLGNAIGLEDYPPVESYFGRRILSSEPDKDTGMRTMLAIADGMVVAVMHESLTAMKEALDRLDGHPDRLTRYWPGVMDPLVPLEGSPDRSLLLLENQDLREVVEISVDELTPENLEISARGSGVERWFSSPAVKPQRDFSGGKTLVKARIPDALAGANGTLDLLGWPYYSKVSLFSVPGLLWSEVLSGEVNPAELAERRMEQISNELGVSWKMTPTGSHPPRWVFQPESPMVESLLKREHFPAALVFEDSLLIGSSRAVLDAVAIDAEKPGAVRIASDAWLEGNLPELGRQLKPLLGMWMMQKAAQSRDPESVEKQKLRLATALETLEELPLCRIDRLSGSEPGLSLKIGRFSK